MKSYLFLYWSSKYQPSRTDNIRLPLILIEGLIQKSWCAEKIDLEKSFPKIPNMTYFACVKAEIIASEVDFVKKSKKLIFFGFSQYRKS